MAKGKGNKNGKPEKAGLWSRIKDFNVRVAEFFGNTKTQFVLGVVLLAFAVFLCSSFVSFFSNGGADQSVVEGVVNGTGDSGDVAANSSGKGGAVLAHYLVNSCFGWASVLFFPLLVVYAISLMRIRKLGLMRWTVIFSFCMIWLSLLFSFVFGNGFDANFASPGGRHGDYLKALAMDSGGVVGVILLLALMLLFFMIYLTKETIPWLQRMLVPSDSKPSEKDGKDDTGFENGGGAESPAAAGNAAAENEEELPANGGNAAMDAETEPVYKGAEFPEEPEEGAVEVELPIHTDDALTDDEIAAKLDEMNRKMGGQESIPENAVNDDAGADDEHNGERRGCGVAAGEETDVVNLENGGELTVEEVAGDNDMGGNMLRPINPKDELSYYKPPTIDLLDRYETPVQSVDRDEQSANADKIVEVLKNFGIDISSIKASVGPTITLYEITPAPGVRISKIRNLEDDIAMSLSALCIRIVAPIPGRGTIGIEVPNANKQIVPMASLLNSRKYKESDMALPLALGKTISNDVYIVDMAKMPHLLVAGATGMGKSVGLNAIITSLLYKMHPAYLKFVMVDPKMVELSLYSVLEKHFLAKLEGEDEPIITDVAKVVRTLKSLCVEMDNRYKLLQLASVRSVKEYNEKFLNKELLPTKGHRFMPYIVVIIDEYGDLMMTAGREVEQPIARIAQKARAVGIHMIIATQRPTTNIITGTIKANFPARMAFRVISAIDSRTILDRSGANQLQGRGDMLFLAGNDPVRVQCALVETKEVERVCAHIAKQQGYTHAYYLPEPDEAGEMAGDGGGSMRSEITSDKLDPLFAEAARAVVLAQHGSTSLIQRKFNVGFNRAGRIMDQLCQTGIVGEQEGSKPRQVLCADEADLEFRLKALL